MSDLSDAADNVQRAESTPGPDETVCYMCRKIIKSNAWTCPYCGKIFEKLLLSTLTRDSLSGPQKDAYLKGYQDCKTRWKETKDISVSISTYKPSPGYVNAYRAGWKRAADELEVRGGMLAKTQEKQMKPEKASWTDALFFGTIAGFLFRLGLIIGSSGRTWGHAITAVGVIIGFIAWGMRPIYRPFACVLLGFGLADAGSALWNLVK